MKDENVPLCVNELANTEICKCANMSEMAVVYFVSPFCLNPNSPIRLH